jgi:hypothetical protein
MGLVHELKGGKVLTTVHSTMNIFAMIALSQRALKYGPQHHDRSARADLDNGEAD